MPLERFYGELNPLKVGVYEIGITPIQALPHEEEFLLGLNLTSTENPKKILDRLSAFNTHWFATEMDTTLLEDIRPKFGNELDCYFKDLTRVVGTYDLQHRRNITDPDTFDRRVAFVSFYTKPRNLEQESL